MIIIKWAILYIIGGIAHFFLNMFLWGTGEKISRTDYSGDGGLAWFGIHFLTFPIWPITYTLGTLIAIIDLIGAPFRRKAHKR